MSETLVSIICPVFKAEAYLHRCINSIIAQTLSDWELILVDDGSPDNSGFICDSYAAKDSRIKVIHKINGGVSAARQTGIDAARGEYMIHVDPDDWIECTMLEDLCAKAKSESADMVMCDFLYDKSGTLVYSKQEPSAMEHNVVLSEMFSKLHGSCCNKLVKRQTCLLYNAKFPEGVNYSEDVCFNVQLLIHDIKIAYVPKAYYHYMQYDTSITNNFTLTTLENCKRYVSELCTYLSEDSTMVRSAKEMVKFNAFKYGILRDADMHRLFPEVTTYSNDHVFLKPVYWVAFNVHQKMARILFNLYYKSTSFFRSVTKYKYYDT